MPDVLTLLPVQDRDPEAYERVWKVATMLAASSPRGVPGCAEIALAAITSSVRTGSVEALTDLALTKTPHAVHRKLTDSLTRHWIRTGQGGEVDDTTDWREVVDARARWMAHSQGMDLLVGHILLAAIESDERVRAVFTWAGLTATSACEVLMASVIDPRQATRATGYVLGRAVRVAHRAGSNRITARHLLGALISEDAGHTVALDMVKDFLADVDVLNEQLCDTGEAERPIQEIAWDPTLHRALRALDENSRRDLVDTGDLFVAAMNVPHPPHVDRMLRRSGLTAPLVQSAQRSVFRGAVDHRDRTTLVYSAGPRNPVREEVVMAPEGSIRKLRKRKLTARQSAGAMYLMDHSPLTVRRASVFTVVLLVAVFAQLAMACAVIVMAVHGQWIGVVAAASTMVFEISTRPAWVWIPVQVVAALLVPPLVAALIVVRAVVQWAFMFVTLQQRRVDATDPSLRLRSVVKDLRTSRSIGLDRALGLVGRADG